MAIRAGVEREKSMDYRAGLQVATLINVAPKTRRMKTFVPSDFFPSLKPAPRVQTPLQQRNALLAIATFSGAEIKRIPAAELRAMIDGN